ncbi:MAG: hypothetical protein GY816_19635 [Cytophagales bacterium]|nr:hypothetical protein [Cytophagales bacterium]
MIKDFLLKPYLLLGLRPYKWLFCFTGPILSSIYLLAAKPYGFSWFRLDEQIRLSLYYSIPVIGIWYIHLFLLQPIVFKKLHAINTTIWLAWIHFVISMYVYAFSEIYIFDSQFDWYFFPDTLILVFRMGAIETIFLMATLYGYLYWKSKRNTKSSLD